jgi:hypothetical protein
MTAFVGTSLSSFCEATDRCTPSKAVLHRGVQRGGQASDELRSVKEVSARQWLIPPVSALVVACDSSVLDTRRAEKPDAQSIC